MTITKKQIDEEDVTAMSHLLYEVKPKKDITAMSHLTAEDDYRYTDIDEDKGPLAGLLDD